MNDQAKVEVQDGEVLESVSPNPKKPNKRKGGFLDSFFQVSANNSSFRAEAVGGLTTFFAMCYILIVNPSTMTGAKAGTPLFNAVFIATAIGAIIGTLFMALYARMPFAQAPGMGLNAFFFTSFMIIGLGTAVSQVEKFQAGMSVVLIAGLLFMLLSLTGLRKKIAEALPHSLKKAIPAGIGLFIAFIGFKNSGLVSSNLFTFVQLGNMVPKTSNWVFSGGFDPANGFAPIFVSKVVTWYTIAPILVAFIGLMTIAVLAKTKHLKKVNVILGILVATGLYYLFNIGNAAAFAPFKSLINPGQSFVDFGKIAAGSGFLGFKFWNSGVVFNVIVLAITFCLVDMFDTLGTLQGTAAEANLLDENGNPKNLGKCLMADSAATVCGGVLGTSTVTTFVESAAGVGAGARTGFSSLIVAGLFFLAMFLSPLAAIIPTVATAPALIFVGVLMLKNIQEVDFKDVCSAVPAFLTLIIMPLSYSISNGIGVGMISYCILKVAKLIFTKEISLKEYFAIGKGKTTGDFWSKDLIVLSMAILFTLRFFLVQM